jgi:hypothetical protein
MDNKTIGVSALITLGLLAISMIGPTFFEDTNYYCEDKQLILECPGGLSGGKMTRCYLTEEKNTWNYCSTGWLEITDDFVQEEPEETNQTKPEINWNTGKWKCDPNKCEKVE